MDLIHFTVNGNACTISSREACPDMSLADYLRTTLQLFGTKTMCREGGCGACVVSAVRLHPVTGETRTCAVNSCLVNILSCHNWDITTIEGLGNRRDGYHEVQRRLAAFNGTQCGYCSPGWVMGMHSLYQGRGCKITDEDVEHSFGGHMCRCTGYRPILDAFKTFATDFSASLPQNLQDMEDLPNTNCLNNCKGDAKELCKVSSACHRPKAKEKFREMEGLDSEDWCFLDTSEVLTKQLNLWTSQSSQTSHWYKVSTIKDIFDIWEKEGLDSYRLVAGNTGKGVYPILNEAQNLIDISDLCELQLMAHGENLVIGAGMTLSDAMTTFEHCSTLTNFGYLDTLVSHLKLVAHPAVRNIGTLGGNLALKNAHPAFPSDVFVLLDTVGAIIIVVEKEMKELKLTPTEFMQLDLKGKVIARLIFPPIAPTTLLRTYKIMQRAQNAHAIVNAGFLFKMAYNGTVKEARIVYGAMSDTFSRAKRTESALTTKPLRDTNALQTALKTLNDELQPQPNPPEPEPTSRKILALSLFYKAVLSMSPAAMVATRYWCGGVPLQRPISRGLQSYDTDRTLWPLTQPVPKLEALAQCAGEARYSCDVGATPRDVYAALVLAPQARAQILGFDATAALKMPGVIAFLTAKDIPGQNTYTPLIAPAQTDNDEILCSKYTLYVGQPVALVVATTRAQAETAARAVHVEMGKSDRKPVLTVRDALKAKSRKERVRQDLKMTHTDRGTNVKQVIKDTYSVGSQYHYTMETQSCWVRTTSQGLTVRSSTQWMDIVQIAIAQSLKLKENQVEVIVESVGGAYGGKASRATMVACACALAAYRLDRAVSLTLPITDNMQAVGSRQALEADYEVGIDEKGLIQYLNMSLYSDCGCSYSDTSVSSFGTYLSTLYPSDRWDLAGYSVLTDKASTTWCRAPGTTETNALMEHIMMRIAYATQRDPMDVRLQNLRPEHTEAIRDIVDALKHSADYVTRLADIKTYNSVNAWKKRAIDMSIMAYPVEYSGNFPVTISVYYGDGTVLVAHGGIEMGQGINTKVAQVVAHELGLALDEVAVRGSDTFVSPNSMVTNGSYSSESVAHAAIQAVRLLLARLPPATDDAGKQLTWKERVRKAHDTGVNLQTTYMTQAEKELQDYNVYGACILEVELDALTGQREIRRADILEDTGRSLSPEVDIGQIEGAFMMGLSLWTMEDLRFNAEGRLLTDRTWTYKPFGVRDIPADLRVSFRRTAPANIGVLGSKATGEPALVLAVVVTHALRSAVLEARKEFGYNDTNWLHIDIPYNVTNVLKAISPKIEKFVLK